jgi:hypothetical protein
MIRNICMWVHLDFYHLGTLVFQTNNKEAAWILYLQTYRDLELRSWQIAQCLFLHIVVHK